MRVCVYVCVCVCVCVLSVTKAVEKKTVELHLQTSQLISTA